VSLKLSLIRVIRLSPVTRKHHATLAQMYMRHVTERAPHYHMLHLSIGTLCPGTWLVLK
jgi:hypothetical protein